MAAASWPTVETLPARRTGAAAMLVPETPTTSGRYEAAIAWPVEKTIREGPEVRVAEAGAQAVAPAWNDTLDPCTLGGWTGWQ